MTEDWKIIREYKSFSDSPASLHLNGDKILLSNTGKVKLVNDLLPDLELTLENGGLYISKRNHVHEIYINGLSWPNQTMYRTIYTLFKGKPKKGYNIHHIDFNHLNNSLNNLIAVSVYKHGIIHKENDPTYGIKIEGKYSIIDNRTEFIKLLKDRIILYKEIKKQQQIDKKQQKELEKQLEIQRKLDSGQYKYNVKGELRPIHNAKLGTKTGPCSEETRRKISITMTGRSLPEYQKKQLSDYYKDSKLLTNGIETKRITKDNIETYLANGWTPAAGYTKGIHPAKSTCKKLSELVNGSKFMTNGIERIRVQKDSIQEYLDKGYVFISNRVTIEKDGNKKYINRKYLDKYLSQGYKVCS